MAYLKIGDMEKIERKCGNCKSFDYSPSQQQAVENRTKKVRGKVIANRNIPEKLEDYSWGWCFWNKETTYKIQSCQSFEPKNK